jgi:hypothetical protein
MKHSRILLIFLAAISLLLLSGCVNLLQEITVQEDGSGTLLFALGVETSIYPEFQSSIPDGFDLGDMLENLTRQESVTTVVREQYEQNDYTWDSFRLEVADFAEVFDEARRIGPMTVSFEQAEDGFVFIQTIDVANSPLNIPGINLMDLASVSYTIRLNTPQIIETNGLQPAVGVSTWDVALVDLLQGGTAINQRAVYTLEPYEGFFIPWEVFFPYVVVGFLGLGGVSILIVIIVNTVGKGKKERRINF